MLHLKTSLQESLPDMRVIVAYLGSFACEVKAMHPMKLKSFAQSTQDSSTLMLFRCSRSNSFSWCGGGRGATTISGFSSVVASNSYNFMPERLCTIWNWHRSTNSKHIEPSSIAVRQIYCSFPFYFFFQGVDVTVGAIDINTSPLIPTDKRLDPTCEGPIGVAENRARARAPARI